MILLYKQLYLTWIQYGSSLSLSCSRTVVEEQFNGLLSTQAVGRVMSMYVAVMNE